jgi:hypothetical protein
MTDEPKTTFEDEEREEEQDDDLDVESHIFLKHAPESDDGDRIRQQKLK